jgi:hypothetical protein
MTQSDEARRATRTVHRAAARPLALGEQPPLIRRPDLKWRIPSAVFQTVIGLEEALGREQRHLRVVGDRADAAIRFGGRHDSAGTETSANLGVSQKLNRRAEGVADGPAQQAASVAVKNRDAWRMAHSFAVGAQGRLVDGTSAGDWRTSETGRSFRNASAPPRLRRIDRRYEATG